MEYSSKEIHLIISLLSECGWRKVGRSHTHAARDWDWGNNRQVIDFLIGAVIKNTVINICFKYVIDLFTKLITCTC